MLDPKTDSILMNQVVSDEGVVDKEYFDTKQISTISAGINLRDADPAVQKRVQRLLRQNKGKLPRKEGLEIARDILGTKWNRLTKALPEIRDFNINHQRALLNMSYNMGVSGLLEYKKMLNAIKGDDWREAAWQAVSNSKRKSGMTQQMEKNPRRAYLNALRLLNGKEDAEIDNLYIKSYINKDKKYRPNRNVHSRKKALDRVATLKAQVARELGE